MSAYVGGWLRETQRTPARNAGKDGGMTMHADQLHVDVDTARRLVEAQFPEWRGLPVTELRTSGTVNAIFRIGDSLAAAFPSSAKTPRIPARCSWPRQRPPVNSSRP